MKLELGKLEKIAYHGAHASIEQGLDLPAYSSQISYDLQIHVVFPFTALGKKMREPAGSVDAITDGIRNSGSLVIGLYNAMCSRTSAFIPSLTVDRSSDMKLPALVQYMTSEFSQLHDRPVLQIIAAVSI
ncbi:hypothetical protein SERLA73DRAFT_72008 [Serpula lacrymans var. lacrymans S7.3]|uniref:Uncharacterized protein n=1 Tax=Serpula lacrymans var. lacrymans (strain S7.3) TaxID=936435 RepID=F8PTP3_SERL3|nr:hypothetical protein SERLA73DRAFT_72008 [Serpula lacrymans var. lacrymans S7.3]